MALFIYKVQRPGECPVGEYDSMVVVAADEADARDTRPPRTWGATPGFLWPADRSTLVVTLLGEAVEGIDEGIIAADFYSGPIPYEYENAEW